MSPRVAIITDEPGWHGKRLRQAFSARGVASAFVSLQAARIELADQVQVRFAGFFDRLPDAVFVRGIPGGTLQQVVFHLNVLHAMQSLGVPVYNDGRAIERSVDKSLTSLLLQQAGLPTPPTWVCGESAAAREIVHREISKGHSLLCKPLFGSQGQGIRLLRSADDLPQPDEVDHLWYLQHFIDAEGTDGNAVDWRVFVIGGVAIAGMRRTAPGPLANVAQGGQCHAAVIDGDLRRLAEAAAGCLDMAYAGVDLMLDRRGRWWLIEVNSIPAWRGLQGVSSVDIAACLADDLLRRCTLALSQGAVC